MNSTNMSLKFRSRSAISVALVDQLMFATTIAIARGIRLCAGRSQYLAATCTPSRFVNKFQVRSSSNSKNIDDKLQTIIDSSNLGAVKKQNEANNKSRNASDTVNDTNTAIPSSSETFHQANADEHTISESTKRATLAENPTLPLQRERLRTETSKRIETYLESLQKTIFRATRTLNDATGYSSIEGLKNEVEKLEIELRRAKTTVKECKKAYTDAILVRSQLQQEVNELLTRKHNWSPLDLERFTELYRNDHTNEQLEAEAARKLTDAELKVDSIQLKLTQLILTRYHEEQIWSDKIRSASTWGTWVIMGINVLLFFVATLIVEPWKRKRLVASFEDKVKVAISEVNLLNTDLVVEKNTIPAPEASALNETLFSSQISLEPSLLSLSWLQWTWTKFSNYVKSTTSRVLYGNGEIQAIDARLLLVISTFLGCILGHILSGR